MTEQDIVERLTDAQKRALLAAKKYTETRRRGWFIPTYRDMGKMAASLAKLGLTMTHRDEKLSPLGLSVRSLLEKQNG